MPEQPTKNLYQRVNEVMAGMEALDKTGYNSFQKYRFLKAETLFAALQKRMATAGIVVIPSIEKVDISPGGDKSPVLLATMRFRVVNADDPVDAFEVPWQAQAGANDDKGMNKCATSGMKYFLMRLFFISDEEDPDAEDGSGQAQPSRGTGQRQEGQAPPKPPKDTTARAVALQRAQDLLSRDPEAREKLPKPLEQQTDEQVQRTIEWLVTRSRRGAGTGQLEQNGGGHVAEVDGDVGSRTEELTAYVNDVDAHLQAMKGTRGPLTADQRGTWAALYTRGRALAGPAAGDDSRPLVDLKPNEIATACSRYVQSCLAELSGSEGQA